MSRYSLDQLRKRLESSSIDVMGFRGEVSRLATEVADSVTVERQREIWTLIAEARVEMRVAIEALSKAEMAVADIMTIRPPEAEPELKTGSGRRIETVDIGDYKP